LLYDDFPREFEDANDASDSREELRAHVERLTRKLEATYAVALRDDRTRDESAAMVAEMMRAIEGSVKRAQEPVRGRAFENVKIAPSVPH